MTDVPAVIASALARRQEARTPEAREWPPTARVSEGDLRVMEALPHRPADHRLGLVLRVDSSNEFAEVLLVHSAPDLATDRDVILPTTATSAPYHAVAQTDLRAAIWSLQLGRRVGHLDQQSLAAVRAIGYSATAGDRAATPAPEVQGLYSGTRLAGPLDRRWLFKEAEGASLRRLAVDCTEALLDQELVWAVNPALLRPELLDLADDRELLLIELLHWVQTRRLSLTDDDLELLLAAGALEVDSWSQFSDLGADLLLSLQEVVLRVATGVSAEPETEVRCLLTAAHLKPIDSAGPIDRIHYLAAKEPIAP